jgi:hypothetical protein
MYSTLQYNVQRHVSASVGHHQVVVRTQGLLGEGRDLVLQYPLGSNNNLIMAY